MEMILDPESPDDEDLEDPHFLEIYQEAMDLSVVQLVEEDGVEAVEAVSSRRFDLVLMDIKMPRMDGVQATQAIRALPGVASAALATCRWLTQCGFGGAPSGVGR